MHVIVATIARILMLILDLMKKVMHFLQLLVLQITFSLCFFMISQAIFGFNTQVFFGNFSFFSVIKSNKKCLSLDYF